MPSPLLLVHSHYSLLMAPSSPRSLCEEALRLGHSHLALTDRNALYGCMPFAREALRLGLQPLFGVDLYCAGKQGGRLFVLARDAEGYRSLCRLLTARQLQADFDLRTAALQQQAGLFFLCEDASLQQNLRRALPAGQCFLLARSAVQLRGHQAGVESIAVQECWFARPADHAAQRLFLAVKNNRGLDLQDNREAAAASMHLPSQAQLTRLWPKDNPQVPVALQRAEDLRAACTLHWTVKPSPIFPHCAVPAGESPATHLRQLVQAGVAQRYGQSTATDLQKVQQRMQHELQVIQHMGFTSYFLVVQQIVGLARDRGIAVVGRGSAAGSLVAYALGFTDADPLRYGLLFERFLNPERPDLPDVDLDFCWRRRDELLQAVYDHFGHERVAMIATYNHFGRRAAYRAAATALGVPAQEVKQPSALLQHDQQLQQRILRAAEQLQGAPRHLGVHPGGIVLVPGAIQDHVPLQRASKGLVVTQFDMHGVEALGLVKIDLLGNRALTILQDSLDLLRQQHVPAIPDLLDIPEDDAATASLLQQGGTLGCFQVESPGMRTLLQQMQAQNMDQVIQAVALIRPGPAASGMKELFWQRSRGLRPVEMPAVLEPVLQETLGVMLYQEDVIRVAMAVAGLSASAGDRLRRYLQAQSDGAQAAAADDEVTAQDNEAWQAFCIAGLRQGMERSLLWQVWQTLARFAGYAFCKAHAVTYGRIAYRCVYMKAHHPAAFMAALLSNDAGYYAKGVYVEEAKRLGIRFFGPCVQHSVGDFKVEQQKQQAAWGIRVGLRQVRGLSRRSIQSILQAQKLGAPFAGLPEFLQRSQVSAEEAENLILVGGLACLGHTRPELLWRLRVAPTGKAALRLQGEQRHQGELSLQGERCHQGELLAGALTPMPDFPCLPDYSAKRSVSLQLALLGFSLQEHPVEVLWGAQPRRDLQPLGGLEQRLGQRVQVLAWMVARRRIHTKQQQPMLFFTLEDGTGIVEACLFAKPYQRLAAELQGAGPYLVRGRVESQSGGLSLRVEGLQLCS